MKVQYSKKEIANLFLNYPYVEISFDIENIKIVTSAINAYLFDKYRIKLELLYINKKFSYLYDDIDNIFLQIYSNDSYFLDTVSVLPYQDLFFILKQRTSEFENLIMLCLPNDREMYKNSIFNIDTLKQYSFIVFNTEVSENVT
jgi:hypothetical protein